MNVAGIVSIVAIRTRLGNDACHGQVLRPPAAYSGINPDVLQKYIA